MKNRQHPVVPCTQQLIRAAEFRRSQNYLLLGIGCLFAGTVQLGIKHPSFWLPLATGFTVATIALATEIEKLGARSHELEMLARLPGARVTPEPAPVPVESKTPVTPEASVTPEAPVTHSTAPWEVVGENPISTLIAGVPGAGKGVFMLNALKVLRVKHPEIKTMIIDPKNSPKELGNRQAAHIYRGAPFINLDASVAGEWFISQLEEFKQIPGPKLLVVDELASIMATLQLCPKTYIQALKAYLAYVTSMGASEQVYLWIMTQDASCEGLGMSRTMRANLLAVVLVSSHSLAALGSLLALNWLPRIEWEDMNSLIERSPVNRALFFGKTAEWSPLPRATNLTGNDRDAGKTIPTVSKPTEITKVLAEQLGHKPTYLEEWYSWLETRGTTTIREAQRLAPAHLRANAEGTRAVLKHLDRSGSGKFEDGVFVAPQFS